MLTVIAWLAACSLEDRPQPATGSTIVLHRSAKSGRSSLYTVNTWDQTVSRTGAGNGERQGELVLGGDPTRAVAVGDTLWVTLRGARQVAVLDISGEGAPVEIERMNVGAEPYGIAVTSDGTRVYVALSQEDAVVEIDVASKTESRRFDVMNDPRWLALHPCDCALFVASAYEAPIARIDLESGEITKMSPPETWVPAEISPSGEEVVLNPRNTGDLAVSPRGDALVWPVLYVDNESSGDQPMVSNQDITPPTVPYYTGPTTGVGLQLSVSKFNPSLVGMPVGTSDGRFLRDEEPIAMFVGGFGANQPRRGYITSTTFAPNGTTVYASLETADAVAVIDLRPAEGQRMDPSINPLSSSAIDTASNRAAPSDGNFFERSQALVTRAGNPYAVALDENGDVYVHERGGREVSNLRAGEVQLYLEELAGGSVLLRDFPRGHHFPIAEVHTDPAFEAGRQLFYTAQDARMSAQGAGVSCSTCHFEGRNDGLTWTFDDHPRQTPSLAGKVSETQPVTWTLDVESVALEARITSLGRMGGMGLMEDEARAVASFIDTIPRVDVHRRAERSELVDRGQALFESESVGCSECHTGGRRTDNLRHRVFGMEVDTPSLSGIDATGPYFHDGSAPTLRAVLERVRDGSMGNTSGLSEDDFQALEAYLRSL